MVPKSFANTRRDTETVKIHHRGGQKLDQLFQGHIPMPKDVTDESKKFSRISNHVVSQMYQAH